MVRFLSAILPGCFFIASLFTASAAEPPLPGPYGAEVVRVLDGDSFEARVKIWLGQEVVVTVRLAGIDAAELSAPCASARIFAHAARGYLTAQIAAGGVRLSDVSADKYGGRVVATVTVNGADIGAVLLAAGLARPYRGRRPDWCALAGAAEEGRGTGKTPFNSTPAMRWQRA